MPTCPNCGKPIKPGRRYCSPACAGTDAGKRRAMPEDERFWNRVDVKGENDCWPWKGSRNKGGYGLYLANDKRGHTAHRMAWTLLHGEPPPDKFVCHTCDTRLCCNPAHLWLGTHRQNMADMVAKGRHGGPRKPSRLTEADKQAILEAHRAGKSLSEIGQHYGISAGYAWHLTHGGRRGKVA